MKSIKILHTADWHIGELTGPVVNGQNARELDTLRCIDYLIDQAKAEAVDICLIAGDLFDKSKLWGDTMLKEIEYAADRLRRLAAVAPTVLLFGTANHDSMQAFRNLEAMRIPNLYIITGPEVITMRDVTGCIPIQIAGVPGFDKGYFRAKNPGMSTEEENRVCSKMLGDIVLGLSAQINPAYPAILMAHYTVVGCQLDNGEHVFLQSDIVLPKDALIASKFNLTCLGHIHRAQEVGHCHHPVFYSGPPNALTFNEEGQPKGFWIHDYDDSEPSLNARFIETPSRQFITAYWEERFIQAFIEGHKLGTGFKDAIVRLHYSCSAEMEKQLNRKALEKALYDAGAFYVAEIRPVKIIEELPKEALAETAGPLENLIEYLKKDGMLDSEIEKLVELAKPLIATVSAKMPTGKLSGVFRPKRLEVKNYRSYREESFCFAPVTFAIVNGPNGVGKSAFFGDAISDCLFEKNREGKGDLTGWISNLPEVKSGSITFEFIMGDTDWRVTRTRTKNGKTTLALAELVNGEWENRSADKAADTQEKIIALLGMDAMTFRSCALIMQDAYGLFLEADKEDRMQVLGNLLGLGVYEQLHELAKDKVTEVNRLLEKDKAKLAELTEKLKDKPVLEDELQKLETELQGLTGLIAAKEKVLTELNNLISALNIKANRVQELQKQIRDLNQQNTAKFSEKLVQQQKVEQAQANLQQEPEIVTKAAEYDQAKEQIAVLKVKQPRLVELITAGNQCKTDMQNLDNEIFKRSGQIIGVKKLLANKAELEAAVVQYRAAVDQLTGQDDLESKYNSLQFKLHDAQTILAKAQSTLDFDKQLLTTEIKTLSGKVEMLGDSNCINPTEANCKFLANAQLAKKRLTVAQTELAALSQAEVDQAQATVDAIQQQIDQLQYDPDNHRKLKDLASELRPEAEQAVTLADKAELLATLEEQHQQLTGQRATAEANFKKYADEYQLLNKELQPLAGLEQKLPELERWVKLKEQLPAAKEIVKAVTEAIASLETEIKTRQDQIKSLELDVFALNREVADIYKHQLEANALTTEIKDLQSRQNNLHSRIGGLKAQLDNLAKAEAEQAGLSKRTEPLVQELVRYITLSAAFGLDGIPFAIVRSVVPELAAMANDILGQMTGGQMTLEMRTEKIQKSNKKEVNALEIWITDYIRGSLPYRSRSGGQKVKAALSVAFALADLKARRAGIQLGMMFVDEPPFLDADGTEAYCDALELLVRRYLDMMVIAISHDPAMKARFPQEIRVEDTGEGGSKVRLIA
jgi:exonuclease SbcD